MTAIKDAASVLVAAAIVVGLCVSGWFLYWDLSKSAAGHQAHINRSTYEFQTTLRNQMAAEIVQVTMIDSQMVGASGDSQAAYQSQKAALVDQICLQGQQLSGGDVPARINTFLSLNCGGQP